MCFPRQGGCVPPALLGFTPMVLCLHLSPIFTKLKVHNQSSVDIKMH